VKQSVNNALNVASNSQNSIEAWLSNLSYNPFTFNWINYASIEAFWQSLKFQEWSDDWQECTSLYWVKAKKYWDKVEKKERFTYNWNGYLIWSTEHQNLMKEALMEQLKQNPDKLKLLLDTWNTRLIHKPLKKDWTFYPDSTSIPWDIFSEILMELREKFKPNK
jgi:predicted NAD-dependent protein-ADP-ribosyltransferase YbiA (DUF1768 family)